MYCRKCGAKLASNARFCPECGCETVIIESKEKKNPQKNNPKAESKAHAAKRQKKHEDVKNPYISAALTADLVAYFLALFPWNLVGKGIGTSLPMRLGILAVAALADYHAIKAKQLNNTIYSKYGFRVRPNSTTVAYWLSVIITMIALFALFMK